MDLVRAGAINLAAWHESSLKALGIGSRTSDSLWVSSGPSPEIYLQAITLSRTETDQQYQELEALAALRSTPFAVCDSWAALELKELGYREWEAKTWFARSPGPTSHQQPAELTVVEVQTEDDLREFEIASIEGFESPGLHDLGPFGLHAPGILADHRMRLFLGRLGDQAVSVSMAYTTEEVVGVYGVATLPAYRRRGYGTALTWHAVRSEPSLSAVLQPTQEAVGMYLAMGFEEVGRYAILGRS